MAAKSDRVTVCFLAAFRPLTSYQEGLSTHRMVSQSCGGPTPPPFCVNSKEETEGERFQGGQKCLKYSGQPSIHATISHGDHTFSILLFDLNVYLKLLTCICMKSIYLFIEYYAAAAWLADFLDNYMNEVYSCS